MQRYKERLGIGGKSLSDPNDPRHCIILSLTMDSEGRPPVTVDLSTKGSEATLKDKPFKIKEGSKFTMTAKFKVQHEILSGLQYVHIVKRKGIKVSKAQEMIVCLYTFPLFMIITNRGTGLVSSLYRGHTILQQDL
jgi:Rho GDP-dissociation inhibitor